MSFNKNLSSRIISRDSVVYFDLLNILACLCVISMHCNGIVHNFDNSDAWRRSMVIETLAYWAVPVFCMLSGATMMNYRTRYSTKVFLKRRLMKIGIPLIIWTVVFYFWKVHTGAIVWAGFRDLFNILLNFRVEGVYWFFAPLLMIYISLPVVSKFSDDKRMLQYMIFAGVLTISVLPFVCSILGVSYNGSLVFPMTGEYLLYALIGYQLHTKELNPEVRIGIYLLGIIGALARYLHTAWTLDTTGVPNTMTWGYSNLPCLVLSVAVFVFVKYASRISFFGREKVKAILRSLASASFGIYLIHVFVMNVVVAKLGVDMAASSWQVFGAFLIYFISLAIVKILQGIPYGKYIFP